MRLLIIHPFNRRRDPEAFGWVQAMKGRRIDFVDRIRGEAQRGAPDFADVEVVAWPSIKVEDAGISGRVLAGLGEAQRVRDALFSEVSTHLLLLQADIEHIAAAALAIAHVGLSEAVMVIDFTDEALEALGTPFGRQLFWRLDGAARAQGAKLVLLAARDRYAAAYLRQAGLPVARAPVAAPVGHGGGGRPALDLLVPSDAEGDVDATKATLFRQRPPAAPRAGGEPALWLQYLGSLGDLRNGLWTKQTEFDHRQIFVTEWRPA